MKSKRKHGDALSQMMAGRESHIYAVGQSVMLFNAFKEADVVYHITRIFPPSGSSPQYRIRSDVERHERMVTQDDIRPVASLSAAKGRTLIERIRSHG